MAGTKDKSSYPKLRLPRDFTQRLALRPEVAQWLKTLASPELVAPKIHQLVDQLTPRELKEVRKAIDLDLKTPAVIERLLRHLVARQQGGAKVAPSSVPSKKKAPPERSTQSDPVKQKKRAQTEQEVWDDMALHPKERDEYGYATKLWNRRFKSKGIKLKTIQNCVAEYRKDKYREMLNKTALRAKLPKKPSRES